jgi:hypothetical protein
VKKKDGFMMSSNNKTRVRKKTTKGWKLLVSWINRSEE